jgi:hypothetical protein
MRPTSRLTSRLAALLIASPAAILLAGPGGAEDAGGTRLSFGLSETVEAQTNQGFTTPASGVGASSMTKLSFGLSTVTTSDALRLSGDLGLSLRRDATGNTEIRIGAPHLAFGYDRATVGSALTLNLNFGRDEIDRLRPLSEFIDDNGQLHLPANPDALVGTGIDQTWTIGADLETGRDAPFGLTFSADARRTIYTETNNIDLLDSSGASVGVKGRFDYSDQGDLTLGFGLSHETLEGSADKDKKSVTLGTHYTLSPDLSLSGTLSTTMTNTSGGGQSTSTAATLGADYTLLNGSLSLDLGTDSAELVWQQKFPTAQVTVRALHGPDDTGDGTTNLLGLGYTQSINAVSGMNLGVFYSDIQSPTQDTVATDLIAGYNHTLTKDWGLDLGLNYRVRDKATSGRADSAGLFVTISRNFSFGR